MASKHSHGIVFRSADGRVLTIEELQRFGGAIKWDLVGAENLPAGARLLHQRAQEAGRRHEYKTAIYLLTKASEAAPRWPYPLYDQAFTYLLMGDFDAALAYYQKTLALAPRGFFTAIAAVDTLTREQNGEFPRGTYLAFLSLEWTDDPARREEIVRKLTARIPRFAPAWEKLASLPIPKSEQFAAIEIGLSVGPDAETRGMLQIKRALFRHERDERDEGLRALVELASNPQSTLTTEHLAKALLALVAKA